MTAPVQVAKVGRRYPGPSPLPASNWRDALKVLAAAALIATVSSLCSTAVVLIAL